MDTVSFTTRKTMDSGSLPNVAPTVAAPDVADPDIPLGLEARLRLEMVNACHEVGITEEEARAALQCLRDDRIGFFVKQGAFDAPSLQVLNEFDKKHKYDPIFDEKPVEDKSFVAHRFQSATPLLPEATPGAVMVRIEAYLKTFGFTLIPRQQKERERRKRRTTAWTPRRKPAPDYIGGCKVIKSLMEGPLQLPHCDLATPKGFHRWEHVDGTVCSVLVSLQGMDLDIWGTLKYFKDNNIPFPQHPVAVPSLTLKLQPGDFVMFRFDLIHAGTSYPEKNLRLFALAAPKTLRNYSGVDIQSETTNYVDCVCGAARVERARRLHETIPTVRGRVKVINSEGREVTVSVWECTCPPRVTSGDTHEKWMKQNNVKNLF